MKKLQTLAMVLSVLLIAAPVSADPGILYVDAGGGCGGNSPCHTTVQAAINAANDYDTILVYPGTYDPQIEVTPPCWGGHYYAQGIVVWKTGLTIQAVDPDPANTVIQSTFPGWMDKWRVQRLTGGQWTGCGYNQTGGFNPGTSASPSALMIVKPGVTIEGFTFHRPYDWTGNTYNTAGVMIGGVAPGDPYNLGADNNVVTNNVFSDVWHAVYVWHSSGNRIVNNTVAALNTEHWAAISIYDGYNDAQINLGYTSKYNQIINNTITNKGISVGAWAPSIWTDNTGTKVHGNKLPNGLIGTHYSSGSKVFSGNLVYGYWDYQASDYKFPGESNHGIPPGLQGW